MLHRRSAPSLVGALLCALLLPLAARGQDRELHWSAFDVEARLDADGRLHVRERQSMVFTGDWNGGERRFNVRLGQRLELKGITRTDPATGRTVALQEGSLDDVDHYAWGPNHALRWRSRRSSDPPFDSTTIVYEIDYVLGNILVEGDGTFALRHDFAFADRAGTIEHFTVRLTFDEAWAPLGVVPAVYEAREIPPGEGFVVAQELRYRGAGRPAGVDRGAPLVARQAVAAALLAALLLLGIRFVSREGRTGRFAPLPPATLIDEAWLEEHVFSMLPEEVGAAWDNSTSAPEVAAIIARLVQEKKLETEVTVKGAGWLKQETLHLRLLVDRDDLKGHEGALIGALFTAGSRTTSTDEVRRRYKSSGFDPASLIEGTLKIRLKNLPGGAGVPSPSKLPTLVLFLTAVALMAAAATQRPTDGLFALAASGIVSLTYLITLSQAAVWRSRVVNAGAHLMRVVLPVAILFMVFANIAMAGSFRAGALALAGVAVLIVAYWNSILNMATSRESPARIAMRKRLVAARNYFAAQLREAQPRLRDEWFPYFVAFELGTAVDKWFRAFGGDAQRAMRVATAADVASHASGSARGSSPAFSGFGGGGGFAGGGSSGSWSSAVSSFAAGVSAPSSSSSGSSSSSSGGSSSGGGGGGGW